MKAIYHNTYYASADGWYINPKFAVDTNVASPSIDASGTLDSSDAREGQLGYLDLFRALVDIGKNIYSKSYTKSYVDNIISPSLRSEMAELYRKSVLRNTPLPRVKKRAARHSRVYARR